MFLFALVAALQPSAVGISVLQPFPTIEQQLLGSNEETGASVPEVFPQRDGGDLPREDPENQERDHVSFHEQGALLRGDDLDRRGDATISTEATMEFLYEEEGSTFLARRTAAFSEKAEAALEAESDDILLAGHHLREDPEDNMWFK